MGTGLLLPFINAMVHFTSTEMITQCMIALVLAGILFGLVYLGVMFFYVPKAIDKESKKQKSTLLKENELPAVSTVLSFADVENSLQSKGFCREDMVQHSGLDCSFFHNLDNTAFFVFIKTRQLGKNDLTRLEQRFEAWISEHKTPHRVNWTCIVIFDQWSKALLELIDEGTYENPWRSSTVFAWNTVCSKIYYKSYTDSFRKRHKKNVEKTIAIFLNRHNADAMGW